MGFGMWRDGAKVVIEDNITEEVYAIDLEDILSMFTWEEITLLFEKKQREDRMDEVGM